jgi:hypothetical protein
VSEADPTAPPLEPGKRVTWAELFFDLVFVVAVTRVSALIEDEQSWAGLGRAVVVFVPVYWLWVGTTIQANLRDLTRPALRLQLFTIALAAVFMALALFECVRGPGRPVRGVVLARPDRARHRHDAGRGAVAALAGQPDLGQHRRHRAAAADRRAGARGMPGLPSGRLPH